MLDFGIPLRPIFRLLVRVARAAVLVLLLAPWVTLVLTWHASRQLVAGLRSLRKVRLVLTTKLTCPQGHASVLLGMFECRSCGALFAGHAFQHCPVCGTSCGYVPCEHCGMAVRNPFL